ncbi:NAD(P)/FAD-dependent oxidoreductase [Hwanghaeella grinnelliae]|uniref:NAD(P)/FAD-dependent oxidoreductase n=1 Tax=Hwanghaeella grinnelliae TaxID=2500179 RepID=A0A437QY06_9PROT|nr:NAD(P)/FAD-dependent oxidoreductase [Hwanghaeella grinnelliae]RVU39410.1 NAD(P)/FAD-dependent oxidoreductase [Hwanghaeella grinnelliae]
MTSTTKPQHSEEGLAALADRVRQDLDTLSFPFKPWMPEPVQTPGTQSYDVVIVGAGQAGLSIAIGLIRENAGKVLVIDQAPEGKEGPWTTFARMPTLRSPKYLTGPDWGIPSLTFRSWFLAQWGQSAWDGLDKIPNTQWQDYLTWLRVVTGIPIWNDCRLASITPNGLGYALAVDHTGAPMTLNARKVVLCTGIQGGGDWHIPSIVQSNLPKGAYAHASENAIDFASLSGKRVAVLGAGASAFDQAATALEAGAQSVHLLTRRNQLHRVQTYKHLEQSGFLGGFHRLPDEWRWRFMNYILTLREPPPRETVARVTRHANFTLVTKASLDDISLRDGIVAIETPKGRIEADFLICGTGFTVDLALRPELSSFHEKIANWGDRYAPPADEQNTALEKYPYLGPGFEFTEKEPGTAPYLVNLHLFTFGSTLSQGFSGGGMNGLKYALPRLLDGIVSSLYAQDAAHHFAALKEYDTPEFDLDDIKTL